MSTLSISSPGLTYSDETYNLQWNLSALGFTVAQDGEFGSETRQAVINFQYTWGLTTDGIAGPITQAAIDEAINLMNTGGWDPYSDPMNTSPTTTSGAPKVIPAGGTTVTPTPSGQVATVLKGIDWKWIIFGVIGAVVLVEIMGGRGEGKRRKRRKVKK
jgi:peptidoglycan hydrolase-like protein with peptidoglycan-binding domain